MSGATFRNRLVAMILFDTPPSPPTSPGFQTGWQLIDSTLTLSAANAITVSANVEFYDVNRQRYRAACVSGTAERFR